MEAVQKMTRLSKLFALIFSVLISVLPPAGYFILGYEHQKAVLETEAHMNSILISQIISATPDYWRYEQLKLEEVLVSHTSRRYEEIRRVIDNKNAVIAKSGGKLSSPVITISRDLFDAGVPVGRVEIQASLSPLLGETLIVGISGIFFGMMIFIILRVFPLRALSITLQSLYEEKEKAREAKQSFQSLSFRYEAILTAIPDIIMEVDSNKVYTWANKAGYEFFGSDVLGKEAAYYFEGEQQTYNMVQSLFNGSEDIVYVESWQRRKDGEKRLLAWWCRVLKDSEGNVTGALSTARDINESKRAEAALHESEEKYRSIVDNIGIGVSLISPKMEILSLNNKMREWFPQIDVSQKPLCYAAFNVPPREDICSYCPTCKTLEDGLVHESITETPVEDKVINYRVVSSPVKDREGRVIAAIEMVEDITEHHKMEEALRKSEERFSQIAESTEEWIWEVDASGLYTYASPVVEKTLGYTPEEIVGKKHFYDFFVPNMREQMKKDAFEAFAAKIAFTKFVNSNVHKNGSVIILETSGMPILDSSSGLLGYRGVDIDITEQRRLEDQLRHSQKMEAVGTLAGGIAHDFNNILNVIIGYSTMVLNRLGDDPLSREQINEVLAAADRAAVLTKRLLAFSRKQVVDMKPVNLNETILGMEKMLSRIIGEDIAITIELADRKMVVMADTGQMEQVLMNLISNARDAMPKGGRLTISTEINEVDDDFVAAYGYGKTGTYALISVTDTGGGIDAETKKKIFEPFFTTKGIGKGTGLGLAIAYGIIKQHDGYIQVYSELGKGTTFRILLPVMEGEAAKAQEAEAAVPIKGGTETILAAEDDASVRNLLRIILESFGYTVITAEDGEDAITKYRENMDSIQLLVLDMIMPKKNGKEAYAEIKNISPDIKAIFVSGYTMDIIHQKELFDEGVDFILKPVSPKDLLKKVREALDR